jgi:hypothetical protein
MKKLLLLLILLAPLVLFISCGDDANGPDLKTGIDGTWLVTRTLITPSTDFPNGYQDQQTWTIKTTGETATLTTQAGTINGTWAASDNFPDKHWYFVFEGQDPRTGFPIRITVEIIGASPLKGTNDTFNWDQYLQKYTLADSFKCEGKKQ